MRWANDPYSLALFLTAAISVTLAFYAWHRRTIRGAIPFILLMLGVAELSIAYAFEYQTPLLPAKVFWSKVEYLGIVTVPVAWLLFALQFTTHGPDRPGREVLAFFAVPALTLLLVWTNEFHGLIWKSTELRYAGSSPYLLVHYGTYFWFHTIYSYSLIMAGTVLLLRFFRRSKGVYRRQVGLLLIVTFIPWISNVIYILRINPLPVQDVTPFAFAITGLLTAWGFLRWQILDILPLARDAVLDRIQDAVIVLDAQNRLVDINPAAQALVGKSRSLVIGRPAEQVFEEYGAAVMQHAETRNWVEILEGGSQEAPAYWEMQISPLFDGRGEFAGRLCVLHDITERQRAKMALQETNAELERRVEERTAKLRAVFAGITDIVMVLDGTGRCLEMASMQSPIQGIPADRIIGKGVQEIMPPEASAAILEQIRQALHTRNTTKVDYSLEANGQRFWFAAAISPMQEDRVVLVARDITDRKASEDQLVFSALHDSLTGLPNRRLFMERLERAFERARRHPQQSAAVLFMDLDGFKAINDRLGHAGGDILLNAIATRLKVCMRTSDTIARIGGDEFLVLLEGIQGIGEVEQIAERIHQELSLPFEVDGHQVFCSASIGISLVSAEYQLPEDILRAADAAMYRAKAQGKGRSETFTPKSHAAGRFELQLDLGKALECGEFQLYYQPIVDLKSGEVVSLEALLRWQHPDFGTLYPYQFLRQAEDCGLMIPIGEWTITTVCQQASAWHAAGFGWMRMAVNISAHQFFELDLQDLLPGILARNSLSPQNLELEISQHTAARDPNYTVQTFRELIRLGVQITIDNFENEDIAPEYLKSVGSGKVKIDGSFISEDLQSGTDHARLAEVIAWAHASRLRVVATGVETRRQLALLESQACDQIQGFLVGRPVPAEMISTPFGPTQWKSAEYHPVPARQLPNSG